MERSIFSEHNSVPFRLRSSLLSNLMLLYEPSRPTPPENGITSCLPTNDRTARLDFHSVWMSASACWQKPRNRRIGLYSIRSVCTGSTDAARLVGGIAAARPIAPSKRANAAMTTPSRSNCIATTLATTRCSRNTMPTPAPRPTANRNEIRFNIIRAIVPREAPTAMRTPMSLVRLVTSWVNRPCTPTANSTTEIPAKIPNSQLSIRFVTSASSSRSSIAAGV